MAPLILTSALDGGQWSTSRPDRVVLMKEPLYPSKRRPGVPQSRSGCFGEEQNLLHQPGIERQIVQPVTWSICLLRRSSSRFRQSESVNKMSVCEVEKINR